MLLAAFVWSNALVEARDTLVVFVRYPTPGSVKTRLAATLGEESAARLYDAFVRDLVGRFSGARFGVRWAVAPPDPGFAGRFGVSPGSCCVQSGDDLGARMGSAFEQHLAGRGDRCVLIGSDAPQLGVERIEEAFARLDEADLVLGPAEDGGYYLIAMKRPFDVFSDIMWSVGSVFEETEKRAAKMGLEVAHLARDFDVDRIEDVERLRERLAGDRVRCPATCRVLATTG